jgi:hypothetical protein
VQTDSFLLARLRCVLVRHAEAFLFWTAAIMCVVPIWLFTYLPTQDGPAHLNNAQILKDIHNPNAGFEAFFELRGEPLPNLSSHFLLAALLYLVPALIAEKLLVTLYVLGFAGSLRWFLGAFGPRCRPLALPGLLLVYNRNFWMGFYNYCLSLILVWVILGLCVRWRGRMRMAHACLLMMLFAAAYFTHLVGFLLALAGAIAAAVLASPRRVVDAGLIVLAALPAGCLVMNYFEQTGFFHASAAQRLFLEPFARLRGQSSEPGVWMQMRQFDDELFAHHVGTTIPGSLILTAYWGLLAAITAASRGATAAEDCDRAGRLFPAVFGLCLLIGFLLVPNHLGFTHGGFLKTRLAPVIPLVWLGCLREPTARWPRALLRLSAAVLLVANLILVVRTIAAGNRELNEYTAGLEAAGTGHRLVITQLDPTPTPLVDPLLHAADYYCLGTANINLDNYEAETKHFPIKYRKGVVRDRGRLAVYANSDAADLVLCWRLAPPAAILENWHEVFQDGRLRIYRRPAVR